MPIDLPAYMGVAVKRITVDNDALTLWIDATCAGGSGDAVPHTVSEANDLLHRLPFGLTRNEVRDALKLCRVWRTSR